MGAGQRTRGLTGREIGGLVLLVVSLGVAAALLPVDDPEPPSAAESRDIGWQDPADADELAHDILERVNDERAERGGTPLDWDPDLAELARGWSEEMIAFGRFEHSPDDYREHHRFVATGENIAIDSRTTAEAHVGLMRSEGHRHAILEHRFDAVGIGVVCRDDGVLWVTQIFGQQRSERPGPAMDRAEDPIDRDDRGVACPSSDALPTDP
ncbi:CAP domain-containing protein [Egibacter rhizosphaerae]|uniref:CAP domain-containing protein n=1 Tax=Egibacter rhizosphaerae TaxID=1670831 RepID=A0A411YFL7_9ACTN|nr:CAP domain-containing protein [Egibacter rhizosphaerae]QBI20054.1 CAP domain-containing protein [Egibacter rhizosphaerae]